MNKTQFETAFLHPKYWLLWLGFGLWWLLVQLPYSCQVMLAKGLGKILFLFGGQRKKIIQRNLQLCFPDLSESEYQKLLKDNFTCMGLAFFEVGISWWWSNKRLKKLVKLEGMEHIDRLNGKGALLVAIHLTTLEVGATRIASELEMTGMHRPHKNLVYEYMQVKGRESKGGDLFPRSDVRGVLKALKSGKVLWYAPDQDYGIKQGVFAPFFNIPSATVTTTARFASKAGVPVIPLTQKHLPGFKGYQVTVHPPLENFPTGDDLADATTINQMVEGFILEQPQSYLWAHRRFKTRPPNEPSLYI